MLLAAPPLPSTTFSQPNPNRHTRHRPKLSLQISSLPVVPAASAYSARTPSSALSPTSRNTAMNRTLTAPSPTPSPSSSSSSSSDEDRKSPSLKDKRRRRRYVQKKKAMSAHQPTTPSASFMPSRQPERRARELRRGNGKRVGFVDEVVVHILPSVESDTEEEEDMTVMERAREIERLRQWVKEQGDNSPDGLNEEESREWVRKLVELEMGELEKEDEDVTMAMA